MALAMTYEESANDCGAGNLEKEHAMSRIVVHVVAGVLFVGVGTTSAQESIPEPTVVEVRDTLTSNGAAPPVLFRLDCVDGIDGDVGVTVAIAPNIAIDDPNNTIEGRQNSASSPQNAGDSSRAKAGTTQRWFERALLKTLGFVVRGVVVATAR